LTLRTLPAVLLALAATASLAQNATQQQVFGYKDFAPQAQIDKTFLAVPDAALAGQHLKILTAAPHIAGSEEDHKTALYVAEKFKAAGLETQIVEYKVLINLPKKILIEAFGPDGKKLMTGPSPEHVGPKYGGDPFQDDPRITPAFNGASPSGDVTAEVVYANYGTPADFQKLAELGVSVKGKIVLVRYGANYRGIKVYDAQRAGAAGVLIFSDPADDGYFRGDVYPRGPMRPDTAVQRGATQFLPIYPGDATTPGVASTPDLPESKRIAIDKIQANWPSIPVNPLSYHDAAPILQALGGPNVPHEWQGALPFAYHTGQTGDKITVHMHLEQDTKLRTIWDVVGTIEGTDAGQKDDWVVAGNHRDAWVFGAVDPNSGTAAMLETAHGLGALLKTGWKPKRKVVLCSWDAEEEGLIGSTEWVEAHMENLDHAVAYFNTDVAVSGPNFDASAVPSLMQFVRDLTQEVPSPAGGTVYTQWLKSQTDGPRRRAADDDEDRALQGNGHKEVRVGVLGSGSDFTPFLQHAGVPSTDIGSGGPYGVYHSAFDNYHWFTKFADPTFVYEQQQARVFGLEILHMADTDVLPYDYAAYGKAISGYVSAAASKAKSANLQDDFTALSAAAARFTAAGGAVHERQVAESGDVVGLNHALRAAEEALLNPEGLPHREWYKHTIYAPGEFTGYAAVVIPGVNEGIEAKDGARTQTQIDALASALNKASEILEQAAK
jgi:N-acetylated-alpha-linked acidic dipeptidase